MDFFFHGFVSILKKKTGCPKKVHKFKIIYLCSENRQITKLLSFIRQDLSLNFET